MPGSKPHHVVHEPDCSNNCGYASSNQRHHESYWEGWSDPRAQDKSMMFSDHYYKVVDRQIAENHSTQCSGNATGGQASRASTTSSKK